MIKNKDITTIEEFLHHNRKLKKIHQETNKFIEELLHKELIIGMYYIETQMDENNILQKITITKGKNEINFPPECPPNQEIKTTDLYPKNKKIKQGG